MTLPRQQCLTVAPLLLSLAAMLLMLAFSAHSQPMLPQSVATEEGGPMTYPRTATWNRDTNAQTYVLTVNGSLWMVSTNLVRDVPLVEGTNRLTLYALNTNGTSPTVRTNFLIAVLRITGGDIVSSPSPLGPWTVTNLPPTQTNATGAPIVFALRAWRKDVIEERHVR